MFISLDQVTKAMLNTVLRRNKVYSFSYVQGYHENLMEHDLTFFFIIFPLFGLSTTYTFYKSQEIINFYKFAPYLGVIVHRGYFFHERVYPPDEL